MTFTKAASDAQDDKSANLIVSPLNALQCMVLVANGSAGETRDQMAKALFGTDGASLGADMEEFGDLVKTVLEANKDSVTLTTAYATWANSEHVALREDFVKRLKQVGAEVEALPFSDPSVVDQINDWCSDNTNENITEIIQELSPDDVAILAAALYFKGDWTNEFDADLTEEKRFVGGEGEAYNTDMMRMESDPDKEIEFSYQNGDDFEALALRYGKEDYDTGAMPTMRLVLVRPKNDNVSARDWFAKEAAKGVTPAWLSMYGYGAAEGAIELPKMEIDQEHDLVPVLESLGITDLFDSSKADLTPMVENGRPHVSEVTQKVVFKSDEKGSEAAAVTFARVTLECAMPDPEIIDLKFDRSFAFALQDLRTGAVLFTGIVNKPAGDDMEPIVRKRETMVNPNAPKI